MQLHFAYNCKFAYAYLHIPDCTGLIRQKPVFTGWMQAVSWVFLRTLYVDVTYIWLSEEINNKVEDYFATKTYFLILFVYWVSGESTWKCFIEEISSKRSVKWLNFETMPKSWDFKYLALIYLSSSYLYISVLYVTCESMCVYICSVVILRFRARKK